MEEKKGEIMSLYYNLENKRKKSLKKRNLASWRKGSNTGEYNKRENVSSLM